MKVSELPLRIFNRLAASSLDKERLPADHLGGYRIIATIADWHNMCVLFTEHPELSCYSCELFSNRSLAEKGFLPICRVQVGPHHVRWDVEQGACLQELKANFSVPNSPPPDSSLERWVDVIRLLYIALEKTAEPVKFTDLAMDLVE